MDEAVARVFADYDKRFAEEAAGRSEGRALTGDDRSLPIGPEAGAFLNLLITSLRPQRILELGTSNGYSTLWLATAAREVGAKVITVEAIARKQAYARAALTKAGVAGVVEFLGGDALELLKTLPGPFDFVLLDLWKELYGACLDLFYPKLAPGAIIAADNMIQPVSSRRQAAEYRRAVRAKPQMQSLLLPVGQGIELSRFAAGLPEHLI
ncbi:MAG TPA: class I SAM-dependent methyltransferase [Stellaceae bacterium]|jgi:predicted O-methyltransferase YrrM|nr:class I SAM-dependent methyltransferase [Stellaceae bacterium]